MYTSLQMIYSNQKKSSNSADCIQAANITHSSEQLLHYHNVNILDICYTDKYTKSTAQTHTKIELYPKPRRLDAWVWSCWTPRRELHTCTADECTAEPGHQWVCIGQHQSGMLPRLGRRIQPRDFGGQLRQKKLLCILLHIATLSIKMKWYCRADTSRTSNILYHQRSCCGRITLIVCRKLPAWLRLGSPVGEQHRHSQSQTCV